MKTSALQVHCRDGETVGSPYAIGQNTVANSNYTITYEANLAITQASTNTTYFKCSKCSVYG
jgi:hypothetical protein